MKKLILGLLVAVFMVSGAMAQGFEESCVMYLSDRVSKPGVNDKTAMSVRIKNYDKVFKLLDSYIIENYIFTDDGKSNDKIANDGIYTSIELKTNTSNHPIDKTTPIKSKKFIYNDYLLADQPNGKITIGFGIQCDLVMVYEGDSLFGNSCSRGCIQIRNCIVSGGFFCC